MPRLPRFFLEGVPLHVIQRGNDRAAIFGDVEDLVFLRRWLARTSREHGVSIHAYVLMTNHLHVLVTPSAADSLPGMMQSLGRIYVQYFNDKYRRTGTLWEGRYKATVVQDEAYLLTCMRYIELNPVRAGMADAPERYEWSSHRANALGEVDDLTSPHPIFRGLGATRSARNAAYRELFGQPLGDAELRSIREATQKCWALGDDAFRQRVSASGRRAAPLVVGRQRKPERTPCRSQQRKTRV